MRRTLLLAAPLLALPACAPVVHPPAPAAGFVEPPRTVFSGVLWYSVANGGPVAGGGAPGTAVAVEIAYTGQDRALVRVGPSCELGAAVVSAPYAELPGTGFSRHGQGVLPLDAGATCTLGDGGAITIAAGTAVVSEYGMLTVEAAGRDAQGGPASIHFSGALIDEREAETPIAAPGVVRVHLLAEMVTNCATCSFNRKSIGVPGQFPFKPALEQQVVSPAGAAWTPICAAPCAAPVDSRALLRVAGPGLPDSQPFSLPADRARVVLKSSSTGTGSRMFGWMFVGAGTVFVAVGATMFALGRAGMSEDPSKAQGFEFGGIAYAVGSLAFFLPGLMVLRYQGTTVTTDRGETLAP